jgi:hypothetical protein
VENQAALDHWSTEAGLIIIIIIFAMKIELQ